MKKNIFMSLIAIFAFVTSSLACQEGAQILSVSNVADDISFSIDSISLNCISCHDGVSAPSGQFVVSGEIGHGIGNSHKIGGYYDTVASDMRKFKPAGAITAQGIRLINGRISCASCHTVSKTSPTTIVTSVTTNHSELCFTCHQI